MNNTPQSNAGGTDRAEPPIEEALKKIRTDIVGKEIRCSGGLFSYTKDLPERSYQCLNVRLGSAYVMNIEDLRKNNKSPFKHPTFELLLKNENMRSARWTRGFAIREINLNDYQDY